MKTLNDILDSNEFESIFNIETEKKEIELSGWKYEELISFGKEIAKQIK